LEVYPISASGTILVEGSMTTANVYYRVGAAYGGPLDTDYVFFDFTNFYRKV
jgi:hypothetical protein